MVASEPGADGKPVYGSVAATLAFIRPDQPMYYLANPENGKKVVGGRGKGGWQLMGR